MASAVLAGNRLKLPERTAKRLRGKTVQIVEVEGGILLRPIDHPITETRGFLKGRGFTSEKYLQLKKAENGLEP